MENAGPLHLVFSYQLYIFFEQYHEDVEYFIINTLVTLYIYHLMKLISSMGPCASGNDYCRVY